MSTTPEQIHDAVRKTYGRVASASTSCCAPTSCCGGEPDLRQHAEAIGYDEADIDLAPEGANLGLGCGNPTAMAALRPGEVVLDLGSGAGFDAFQAAAKVGETGRVIGVDMTPEMLALSRRHAQEADLAHRVDFREGQIEALPVDDATADVVLSNCVINLSPDKPQVFREAYRVLKPGGRLAVSDIVLSEPLPEEISGLAEVHAACVGGASVEADYIGAIEAAGFEDVRWTRVSAAPLLDLTDPLIQQLAAQLDPEALSRIVGSVWSYQVEVRKP